MNKSPIISPSIHEAVIQRHIRDDDDAVLIALRDGVKALRETVDKASKLTAAVLSNDMETPSKRHAKARDAGFEMLKGATSSLDAALKKANDDIAAIKALTHAPKPPKDSSLAREMRERLTSLPEDRRKEIVGNAIANDDDMLIGALLSCPAWLTGQTDTSLEMTRASWAKKHFAADLDRAERLSKAIVDAKRAGSLSISFVDHLTDHELIEQAKAKEKAAADALKAAKAG